MKFDPIRDHPNIHATGFDPTYCSKTKYCMRQSVAQVTAGCNKQNVVFNNGLLELQPAVMLQFCNITASRQRYVKNQIGEIPYKRLKAFFPS